MENDFVFNPQKSQQEPPLPEIGGALESQPPAGFNERFIAYVLDAAPFLGLHYVTFTALARSGAIAGTAQSELQLKLAWLAVYAAYEVILSSGGRATLGKLIMGIRVQAKDGGPLPLPRAALRALGYFVSSATLNLGYLVALFTPDNRALHDYIAGSRVVSVRERGDFASGLVLAISWGLMAMLGGAWINNNVLKLSPEEKEQVYAAHRTISKLGVLEEFYFRANGHYTNELQPLAAMTPNVNAVRAELMKTIDPESLTLISNGREYIIRARALNWRKTEVEVHSRPAAERPPAQQAYQ